jgi:hypothetical protein
MLRLGDRTDVAQATYSPDQPRGFERRRRRRSMSRPKSYSSYAEFERDEIRPNFKIGFSIDDLEEASTFDYESLFDEEGDDFYGEYDGDSN